MKLYDVLDSIEKPDFPVELWRNENGRLVMNSFPNDVFRVNICLECEEETWINASVTNPILIPWYDCEVAKFTPGEKDTLNIWIDYEEYIYKKGWLKVEGEENDA